MLVFIYIALLGGGDDKAKAKASSRVTSQSLSVSQRRKAIFKAHHHRWFPMFTFLIDFWQ